MNKDRSNGYRKRLLEEYNQLKERYRDLRLFLIGDTKLRAIDFTLMCKQKEIMENYIQILERRIEKLEDSQKNEKIILHHTGIIKN
jgi:hypothetical protein|nr:MAG TPA: U2 snRNP component [Caudoviricetes sp.]